MTRTFFQHWQLLFFVNCSTVCTGCMRRQRYNEFPNRFYYTICGNWILWSVRCTNTTRQSHCSRYHLLLFDRLVLYRFAYVCHSTRNQNINYNFLLCTIVRIHVRINRNCEWVSFDFLQNKTIKSEIYPHLIKNNSTRGAYRSKCWGNSVPHVDRRRCLPVRWWQLRPTFCQFPSTSHQMEIEMYINIYGNLMIGVRSGECEIYWCVQDTFVSVGRMQKLPTNPAKQSIRLFCN